jgi:NifU-like protein
MSKADLIGGSLWDAYSDEVNRRMSSPSHMGEISEQEAKSNNAKLVVAEFGAESCGDAVKLYWMVEEGSDKILKAKFKSFGCGTAIASSDVMAELCIGKTVDEAIKITNIDVEKALRDDPDTPAVPPQKMHCSVMAYDVIKKAAADYKGINIEEIEDEFIVCECARVSYNTIKEVVKLNNLTTIEEITDYTKAGAFCKSCIKPGGHENRDIYLVDILEEVKAQRDKDSVQDVLDEDISFEDMTVVGKLKVVEKILDNDIRPMLVMDGGNLEIIDLKVTEDGYNDLYFRYLGACSGCASGSTGTLYAIENVLREKVSNSIRVIPI